MEKWLSAGGKNTLWSQQVFVRQLYPSGVISSQRASFIFKFSWKQDWNADKACTADKASYLRVLKGNNIVLKSVERPVAQFIVRRYGDSFSKLQESEKLLKRAVSQIPAGIISQYKVTGKTKGSKAIIPCQSLRITVCEASVFHIFPWGNPLYSLS